MNIYCISGLGADKRVFKNLSINHILFHIEWITPTKNESISNYSIRLSKQINTNEPFILLGLSFGGIIACEMAKFLNPIKVIHISSIINKNDLPVVFRILGMMGIPKIIPTSWYNPPMTIANWFFGLKTEENKKILKEIFKDTDHIFFKWAIIKLLSNEEIVAPENLIRIHGTNDKLLPLRDSKNVITIKDGGHLMVLEQANEVSTALNSILN